MKNNIPRHVAIIMDGNRRWGRKNKLQGFKDFMSGGHWAGASALLPVVEYAKELGIKTLTVWGLSTENLLRPADEVATLYQIYEAYLRDNRQKMVKEGVKFDTIGDLSPLPASVKVEMIKTLEATKECSGITLVVALNYGGRDDLRRACQKIADQCLAGKLDPKMISEETIQKNLDTASYADPDLLIRTSGEMRISNFLLWQLAYTELYITDVLWPDFKPEDLLKAVVHFQNRERRRGR